MLTTLRHSLYSIVVITTNRPTVYDDDDNALCKFGKWNKGYFSDRPGYCWYYIAVSYSRRSFTIFITESSDAWFSIFLTVTTFSHCSLSNNKEATTFLCLNVASELESYLELPLSGHHLGVGARYLDASIEAGAIVCLQHIATKHFIRTDAAVVRTYTTNKRQ